MTKIMDGFVLDCSVTMAWCFEDESTPYTDHVQNLLSHTRAVVPSIWPLEVTNVLLVSERKKRLDEVRSTRFFHLLSVMPIDVDGLTGRQAFGAIAHLARAHSLSSYDAAYLELAIRYGIPIATLDEKLRTAAISAGVELIEHK